MLEILMLTVCLQGQPCKPPQRMTGPVVAEMCQEARAKAQANIARNGRKPSRVDCIPRGAEQVAAK